MKFPQRKCFAKKIRSFIKNVNKKGFAKNVKTKNPSKTLPQHLSGNPLVFTLILNSRLQYLAMLHSGLRRQFGKPEFVGSSFRGGTKLAVGTIFSEESYKRFLPWPCY